MQRFIMAVLILLIPSLALAEGVLTEAANPPSSSLYNYRTSLEIQDDFLSGNTTSGSIGSIGFTSSGTITQQASSANRIGITRIDTGAVSGTLARLQTSGLSTSYLADTPADLVWILQVNTNDVNTSIKVGAQSLSSSIAPTTGIYFEKLDADINWFCVTRSASVETRTDSGVAVNTTSYVTLRTVRNATSAIFALNNTAVCTHTTNLPTVAITPAALISNSTVAAKTLDIDYFQLKLTGLTR